MKKMEDREEMEKERLKNHLDPLLAHFTQVGPRGCGAVVTHHGKVVYEHYTGFADAEGGILADSDTVYRIYSCTKVVTVIAAMQIYEKGRFLLNDAIEDYLPEFKNQRVYVCDGNGAVKTVPANRSITIRDLLSMRSGITSKGRASATEMDVEAMFSRLEEKGGYSQRELVRELAKIPLAFQPGSRFCYGLSHDVIGALIEEVSGKSLGEYFREEIFKPLGIQSGGFFKEDIPKGKLAALYTWSEGGGLVPYDRPDYQFNASHKLESAGAGLLLTVKDMARIASALAMGGTLDGVRILGRKTVDLIRRNQLEGQAIKDFRAAWKNGWEFLEGYGYGLGVRTLMSPEAGGINGSLGEFGWGGVAGTYILADPEEELAIAYAHQIVPHNLEGYCHPRLKQVVYGAL